ncbi:G-protein coupled receptor Mth2, partial [Frankliniella fusca]
TCDGRSSCEVPRGRGRASRVGEELDWRERNCFCDPLCAQYGDCCVDSPHYAAAQQRRSGAIFSCVDLRQFGGIYMKTSCPPGWEDADVRHRCEVADDQSDPVASMPVTSHATGYTYRNAFCALCHGDMPGPAQGTAAEGRLDIWRPRVECPSVYKFAMEDVSRALEWHADLRSWVLALPVRTPRASSTPSSTTNRTSTSTPRSATPAGPAAVTPAHVSPDGHGNATHHFHMCHVDPVLPDTSERLVRRCQADTVRACAPNWTNQEVRSRCEAYTAYVYLDKTPYRNAHCAICNNIGLHFLQCQKALTRSSFNKEFSPIAFAVLFDLNYADSAAVGTVRICPNGQLFDPFFHTCRSVVCPVSGAGSASGSCVNGTRLTPLTPAIPVPPHTGANESSSTLNLPPHGLPDSDDADVFERQMHFDACPKFLLEPSEFELTADRRNATVVVYNRTFREGEFMVTADGKLAICAYASGIEFVDKFGPYMGYVTLAGLGVSVVFLLLHLLAFALVPELRNLSGKNLASLCLSLLVAYVSFIAGQLLGREGAGGAGCLVAAVLTYYSFLASFSWMLTMALDVWRTLRLATCELRVSAGKQWRKFVLYSVWTWLMPAAIVCAALFVDAAAPGTVDDQFRPGFGFHACWFAHRKALLVFFAAPLAIIMFLNVVLFASSALMIVRTAPALRYAPPPPGGTSGTRRDFRLYIRLAIVMGLTWTVGLIAGCLDIDVLWYAFVALNTLQGLFIFLAFTCTEKVVRGLGEALPCACLAGLFRAVGRAKRGLSGKGLGDKAGIRPPSFSWSGSGGSGSASNDSTHKSALGSSSESSSPSHHGLGNGHSLNGHGLNGHGLNGHGLNGHGLNGHGLNGHSSVRHPGHRHHHATSDTLY